MRRFVIALGVGCGLLGASVALAEQNTAPPEVEALRARAAEILGSVPPPPAELSPAAALGRRLFFDARMAADRKTACVACHLPERHGADGLRFSLDARGKPTARNSPTVFHVDGQIAQRWRGDRTTPAQQAEDSLVGSLGWPTHDAARAQLLALDYESDFRAAFPDAPDPVSTANFGRAIEAFEATLSTPALFDAFLRGETSLSSEQRRGLALFLDTGCTACHNGPAVGGRSLQRFGVVKPYAEATGSDPVDEGRFAVTKQEADRYVFKVPPLRNVAKTGPWFHDGSVADLAQAVRVMADVQLGKPLGDADANAIAAFLATLTGEVPPHFSAP
jgi:cytochrome c peroxidase